MCPTRIGFFVGRIAIVPFFTEHYGMGQLDMFAFRRRVVGVAMGIIPTTTTRILLSFLGCGGKPHHTNMFRILLNIMERQHG